MATRGGKRPGAGNKTGSIRPHITAYWTKKDIEDYFKWLKKAYKKNPRLATWIGDQISGKAAQPLTGPDGGPIQIEGVEVTIRK